MSSVFSDRGQEYLKYFSRVLEDWAPTSCSLEERGIRDHWEDEKTRGPIGIAGVRVSPVPHSCTAASIGPVGSGFPRGLSVLCSSAPSPRQASAPRPSSLQSLGGRGRGTSPDLLHSVPPTPQPVPTTCCPMAQPMDAWTLLTHKGQGPGVALGSNCEGHVCLGRRRVQVCGAHPVL